MSVTHPAAPLAHQKPSIAHRLIARSNPLMVRFAGSRWFPLWSKLEHRGRKSGRTYTFPVVAQRTPDGFVIPMPFGEGSDWVRNVLASGSCAVLWKGRRYEAGSPEVIDRAAAASAFNLFYRSVMRLGGMDRFMRVRTTD
jgi:deazaflavin-dependent oxidoreductase (nitroreductase family)